MAEEKEGTEVKQLDSQVENAIEKAIVGKYIKCEAVGRGSYGQVWRIQRIADGQDFVAKVMAQEKKHRHDAEIKCLASCSHFGVVKLVDNFQSDFGPVIVLEYCNGGDLSKKIKSHAKGSSQPKPFSEDYIGTIFVQLCMSLQHLHSRRMLHRDIKAANVLLTSRGIVQLSDFGFSRQFDGTVSQNVADTFLGTPYYLAPELWRRQRYGKKADVWSLGIVLYEMLTLKRPFVSSSMKGLMQSIVVGEYDAPRNNYYSAEMLGLLQLMLKVDPAQRASVAEILQTPLMQKYAASFKASVEASPVFSAEEKEKIIQDMALIEESLTHVSAEPAIEDDLEPTIIFEGHILIGSAKDWKPRYLVLNDTGLLVTRVKEDRRSQQLPLESIVSVGAADSVSMENVFVVSLSTGYTVWMRAANAEERNAWISRINEVLKRR